MVGRGGRRSPHAPSVTAVDLDNSGPGCGPLILTTASHVAHERSKKLPEPPVMFRGRREQAPRRSRSAGAPDGQGEGGTPRSRSTG
ncbi:hypothetical protein NDU88_001588 [Pleurodeles waltl]|uniref:Uncharacterized protein n=1 Tax=Pleurodeles waltl TaxID=8319 RepID=A0AAV7Q4A1_PLEWA|nr:hypothetical protein NDU88_001588 [Pleurodeles waltl]